MNSFNYYLVNEFQRRGWSAEVLVTDPAQPVPAPMPRPGDVPIAVLHVNDNGPKARAAARNRWVAARAPAVLVVSDDMITAEDREAMGNAVKVIAVIHNDTSADIAFAERCARHVDAVVAVSGHIATFIAGAAPRVAAKLHVIPHGVPVPELPPNRPSQGPLRVVYAGRLALMQKRAPDVVAAAVAAQRKGANLSLSIAGGGTQRPIMEGLAAATMAPGTVEFLGTLPIADVRELFRRSDVQLLTSDYEGFGLSLLEGMAHGVVPVATRIDAGFREFVQDGETGLLVPSRNIRKFAEALLMLDQDRDLLESMSRRARAVAESYSVGRMADHYVRLIQEIGGSSVTEGKRQKANVRLSRTIEIGLRMEALIVLTTAHLALRFLPFRYVARHWRRDESDRSPSAADRRYIEQVRRAVIGAARSAPFRTKCLAHAIAAKAMLRRRGVDTTLFLGLRRRGIPERDKIAGRKGDIVAHAWLSANGLAIVGGSGEACSVVARYT